MATREKPLVLSLLFHSFKLLVCGSDNAETFSEEQSKRVV